MKITLQKTQSGYLFLFSLLLVFVVTPLFQQGVFGDGIMYLTVAFNRFKGYGSFWEQHYSETSMSFFCEQPPLYFEALNGFYKIFGGAVIAEKVFTLVLLISTVVLTSIIWNRLNTKKYKQLSWLPSLLLMLVPVYVWAFCNQVIETMVVPLSLTVLYLYLVFMQSQSRAKQVFSFSGTVALLFLLLLTKGAQSVFLLGALFLLGIIKKEKLKKLVLQNLLIALAFFALCALVFLSDEKARFWLNSYFNKRLVATFNHVGATANYHAEIIVRYFSELIPVFVLLILISIYFKIKRGYSFSLQWKGMLCNKVALWLILISFSASLPMALTLEQRGFYLSPAFPFMALALALLYKKYFFVLSSKVFSRRKLLHYASLVFIVASLVFFFWFKNGYKRDEGMIKDVQFLKKIIPYGAIIGINQSTWNTFSLHSYLNKENNNSLAVTDTTTYFIQEKENKSPIPANFTRLNIKTLCVDVYVKPSK